MYKTLPEAKQALTENQNGLNSLSKGDVTELKSLSKPPVVVLKVLSAVYKLLNPETKKSEITWQKCKAMMAEMNFLLYLTQTKNVSSKTYDDLLEFTADPELKPEFVRKVSAAAAGMMQWVHALMEKHRIEKCIEHLESKTSLE